MSRKEYDINQFLENYAAMTETRSASLPVQESDGSLMPNSERHVLMSRIAGQLGISDPSKLPYMAELAQASQMSAHR